MKVKKQTENKDLAWKLVTWRVSLKMTQTMLAHELKITQAALSSWESGKGITRYNQIRLKQWAKERGLE